MALKPQHVNRVSFPFIAVDHVDSYSMQYAVYLERAGCASCLVTLWCEMEPNNLPQRQRIRG